MPSKPRRSAAEAFTFIEVLITLGIVAVMFVPVMQLFSHSLTSSGVTQDIITSTNLARWEMERMRNLKITAKGLEDLGDVIYPPIHEPPLELNNVKWRIKRDVIEGTRPLEVHVHVYPITHAFKHDYEETEAMFDSLVEMEPLMTLVTLVEDFHWEEVSAVEPH